MEHVKKLGLGTYEMDLSSSNPETKELLDAAQKNGIKVIAKLWTDIEQFQKPTRCL